MQHDAAQRLTEAFGVVASDPSALATVADHEG